MGAAFVLIGFVVLLAGFISILKPITILKIKSRKNGAAVTLVGLVMFIAGGAFLENAPSEMKAERTEYSLAEKQKPSEGLREEREAEEAAREKDFERANEIEQKREDEKRRAREEIAAQVDEQRREREFIDIIRKYRAAYKTATNDIKRFNYLKDRSRELREVLPDDLEAKGWTGNFKKLSTDSYGNANIAVEIDDGIALGTYGLFNEIKADSSLWQQVGEFSIGQEVVFSGYFSSTSNARFPRESSLTERGSMSEPEFHFEFLSVLPR